MAEPDDIRARDFGGVFTALSNEQLETLIEDAECMLPLAPWEAAGCADCYDRALIYMAMHLGAVNLYGQASGPLTSASAGGLSASWGGGSSSTGLGSTRWGQLVDEWAARCGLTGPFVLVGQPACY